MFKSLFFGTYLGFTMAMAIIIDQDGRNTWYAAWFVLLAGYLIM